jgi:hypothetical protein
MLVLTFFVTGDLKRAVSDYLIGVHVGAGAGATLNCVNNKLAIEVAIANLNAGLQQWLKDFFG